MDTQTHMFDSGNDTQDQILNVAARLFALKGFKAVTLKSIAKEVGIKVASIYYYYANKSALIDDILSRFTETYDGYYVWLAEQNKKAQTPQEVIDNLFDILLLDRYALLVRFGTAMAIRGQNNVQAAHHSMFNHFYVVSVQSVKASFDSLVERKLIPPADTETLATIYLYYIMGNNEMRLNETMEMDVPIDPSKVTRGFKKMMLAVLTQGVLEETACAGDDGTETASAQ